MRERFVQCHRNLLARALEVEPATAIYSGLLCMADLMALQPNLSIKLHIVAPDDKREKVTSEIRRPVFSLLDNGPLYDRGAYLSYDSLAQVAALPHLSHMTVSVLDECEEHAGEGGGVGAAQRLASAEFV